MTWRRLALPGAPRAVILPGKRGARGYTSPVSTSDPHATAASAEQSHTTKGLLRLTMACNERCPFCNVPVEDYPRPTPPPEQIAAELDAFVATGQRTLTISGGEPTLLRKRLLALVAEARRRGIPLVELQTNAVLIDEGYAAALAGAGLTSAFVSLLSHQPDLHDQLAGLDGAWPRCLAGIDALLGAGVRVTLNPVFARPTQDTVADYVDFVARRLPGVRSISLSAIQPHGRARRHLDALLPDYDRLAVSVRAARARAAVHGIALLNPYCGLPLCVGWEDGLDASVEAIEAAAPGPAVPGVDNRGDKAHGAPCRRCALRTRCGGAWHAWLALRGTGLHPPALATPPWRGGEGAHQVVLAGVDDHGQRVVPTRWLRLSVLTPAVVPSLLASDATDLAVERPVADLDPEGRPDRPLLAALRRLERVNARRAPQRRLRVWLRLSGSGGALHRAAALAQALGVHALAVAPGAEGPGADVLGRLCPGLLVEEG